LRRPHFISWRDGSNTRSTCRFNACITPRRANPIGPSRSADGSHLQVRPRITPRPYRVRPPTLVTAILSQQPRLSIILGAVVFRGSKIKRGSKMRFPPITVARRAFKMSRERPRKIPVIRSGRRTLTACRSRRPLSPTTKAGPAQGATHIPHLRSARQRPSATARPWFR
jgi:hypothetical protein